jgi:hypothetical protein
MRFSNKKIQSIDFHVSLTLPWREGRPDELDEVIHSILYNRQRCRSNLLLCFDSPCPNRQSMAISGGDPDCSRQTPPSPPTRPINPPVLPPLGRHRTRQTNPSRYILRPSSVSLPPPATVAAPISPNGRGQRRHAAAMRWSGDLVAADAFGRRHVEEEVPWGLCWGADPRISSAVRSRSWLGGRQLQRAFLDQMGPWLRLRAWSLWFISVTCRIIFSSTSG